MLHRLIGAAVLLMWCYTVTHMERTLPGLAGAMKGMKFPLMLLQMLTTRVGSGVACVLLMPLVSVSLLWFPGFFADRFSPKAGMFQEPILDSGFWRLAGYFALLVSFGLAALFRQI